MKKTKYVYVVNTIELLRGKPRLETWEEVFSNYKDAKKIFDEIKQRHEEEFFKSFKYEGSFETHHERLKEYSEKYTLVKDIIEQEEVFIVKLSIQEIKEI